MIRSPECQPKESISMLNSLVYEFVIRLITNVTRLFTSVSIRLFTKEDTKGSSYYPNIAMNGVTFIDNR